MSSATIAVLLLAAGGMLTSVAAVFVFFHQECQSAEIHGSLTGGDSYPYLEPLV